MNGALSPGVESRLGSLARGARGPKPVRERCELCAAVLAERHPHLVELGSRTVLRSCSACAVLFDDRRAGGGRYRRVTDRRQRLGLVMAEDTWHALAVPVGLAFFTRRSADGAVRAHYPGALGVAEAAVDPGTWERLTRENPVVATAEPDVEALLVCRANGLWEHWIVGLDACYALAAIVRRDWRGFGGGEEAWASIRRFFHGLARPERK